MSRRPEEATSLDMEATSLDMEALTLMKAVARKRFAPNVVDQMQIRRMVELVSDELVYELSTYVYGKRGREASKRVDFTFPATWWDCLKRDVFNWAMSPRWLVSRSEAPPAARAWRWLRRRVTVGVAKAVVWFVRRHPVRVDARVVTVDFSEQMLFPDAEVEYLPHMGDSVVVQVTRAKVEGNGGA